jgi:hypothetical protein
LAAEDEPNPRKEDSDPPPPLAGGAAASAVGKFGGSWESLSSRKPLELVVAGGRKDDRGGPLEEAWEVAKEERGTAESEMEEERRWALSVSGRPVPLPLIETPPVEKEGKPEDEGWLLEEPKLTLREARLSAREVFSPPPIGTGRPRSSPRFPTLALRGGADAPPILFSA